MKMKIRNKRMSVQIVVGEHPVLLPKVAQRQHYARTALIDRDGMMKAAPARVAPDKNLGHVDR